jgi:hypothetical protein
LLRRWRVSTGNFQYFFPGACPSDSIRSGAKVTALSRHTSFEKLKTL